MTTRRLVEVGLLAALAVLAVLLFATGATTSALATTASAVCWIGHLVSRAGRRENTTSAADE